MSNHRSITQLQVFLKQIGYFKSVVDGINGPKTKKAVKAFQKANGLAVDGIAGNRTWMKIDLMHKQSDVESLYKNAPWMRKAYELLHTKEYPGAKNNPVIMGWAKKMNLRYANDAVPWCGLFVGNVVTDWAKNEKIPGNVLGARQWQNFGRQVRPCFGSILVFWRGKKSGWTGHVGFYVGEDKDCYHVLGGNQSNAVTIQRIVKRRLLSARYPHSAHDQSVVRMVSNKGIILSTNEA